MGRKHYFIGLDDTDYGDSIGTGALCRELMVHLQRKIDVTPCGITRHQFLIHPDIPYTSHNSSACLEIETDATESVLKDICERFITFLFHPGADPGVCIARKNQLNESMVTYGRRAQREVVDKKEAYQIAEHAGVFLKEYGGEGIGVIGALSGCALRMDGNDGRFILHKGIRETELEMTVKEIIERTAVEMVLDQSGKPLSSGDQISTNNWIRPDLKNGKVILMVKCNENGGFFINKKKKGVDDM